MIRRWKDSFAQAFLRENLFYGVVLFLNKKKDCQNILVEKNTNFLHTYLSNRILKKYVDMCNLKKRNSSIM